MKIKKNIYIYIFTDLSIENRSTQLYDFPLLADISQRNRDLPISTYSRKRTGSKLSRTSIK